MADTQQNPFAELVREARARVTQELQSYAEQLQGLEKSVEKGLQELHERHQQLEGAMNQQLETLEKFEPPAPPPPVVDNSLEKVLGGVRNLIAAMLPEQVLEVLTQEAQQLGVRAVVFDVRGRAAWGSSAGGFAMPLSDKALHGLVIPLNQEGPFRKVFETAGPVDASPETLRRHRNLLDRLKPAAGEPILLLPIRSAGAVSAIFYADTAEKGKPLPGEALGILTEFAGAQLDRLMALSGVVGTPAETPASVEPEAVEAEAVVETAPAVEVAEPAPPAPEPVEQPSGMAAAAGAASTSAAVEAEPVVEEHPVAAQAAPEPVVEAPAIEPPAAPSPEPVAEAAPAPVEVAAPAPPAPAKFDLSQLSDADQKIHKDAKRFAKLLVSEIELYNKTKVADGRKGRDLYKRLKSDIDRSRQTYEKRFGKTVGRQFDYFHDEVVKTLAGSDAALLGPDYPGPSV
ncbi:MAG: hypothetical protein LAP13_11165 [Acidobacteriia bacterium]|nr:hypothetical protein [Terriglobia bacterium]